MGRDDGIDWSAIELFAFDVDGVLTDGSINLDDDGRETKRFCVRDGYGFRLWREAGFRIAIITGRGGPAMMHRMRELGVDEGLIIQGSRDKSAALDVLMAKAGVGASGIAYMGDDWPDLPALARAGLSVCPSDAESEVIEACRLVTRRRGGQGAAREAICRVLAGKGLMGEGECGAG